jgi:putative transposase
MKVNRIKTFYRRSLPHLQPVGATFFVTFRLAGSIPKIKILELQEGFEEIKNYLLEKRPPNFKEKLIKEHYRFFPYL